MERDKFGRFVKNHSWDKQVLEKMSKTKLSKSKYKDKTATCECCGLIFIYRPNKHHPKRRFCTRKCVLKTGGRKGVPLNKKSKKLMSEKMSGKANPMFINGCSKRRKDEYENDYKISDWRKAIFKRDDYTCQICFKKGGKLNADHIKTWSEYPNLRFELSNGRTLCVDCHKDVTSKWLKKNWKNQFSK